RAQTGVSEQLLLDPGASPPDPLHAHSRGPRAPRRSRGSLTMFARYAFGCLDPGASPPDPLHAHSRGPRAPRRSRRSLTIFARYAFGCLDPGASPPDPLHAHSAGTPRRAPFAWLAHDVRSLRFRVRLAVRVYQLRRVDMRVPLRRAQPRVSEQLL